MTDKNSSDCTIDELINMFREKGGKINKFYLQSTIRNKRTLVHLNGWHSGGNIREAIVKALTKE